MPNRLLTYSRSGGSRHGGTGLLGGAGGQGEDQLTSWWQRLIEGAAVYEPKLRWTIREVLTHLRA
jgi:hypothetical protein